MSRVVPQQSDLFAPPARPAAPPLPQRDPLEELADVLAALRVAESLPWPDLSVAMEAEYRVMALARAAGEEGARLASAIMDESERLFSAAEQRDLEAAARR